MHPRQSDRVPKVLWRDVWLCLACGYERPVNIEWPGAVLCEARMKRNRRWGRCRGLMVRLPEAASNDGEAIG